MSEKNQQGFTLLEMAIVIGIIGLIAGGLIVGQSLLRNAELRAIITDGQALIQAVDEFKDKYNSLPGDMYNATGIWGAEHATNDTCMNLTTASTGVATCNGDGNGKVTQYKASGKYEYFRFWQHLANAQMIAGKFTGVHGSAGALQGVSGQNVPTSALSKSGDGLTFHYLAAAGNYFPDAVGKHLLQYGKSSTGNAITSGGILTAKEAWVIDGKVDDGAPGTGFIMNMTSAAGTCATTAVASTAVYNITVTTPDLCHVIFVTSH